MPVQFILGRAGSGKTHYCLKAVREQLRQSPRGSALVLLVPEQATYQTERALVTTPGLGGYSRAFVLSFQRLAYQVLLEAGGANLPPLEAAGKQMVLRSILKRRGGELRLFEKSARLRGFLERLALTMTEFRSYGFWTGRLRAELAQLEQRGEGDTLLAAKLHDLAIVVEEYEKFLAARYVDPDCHLDLLAERLAQPNQFHGARVWVDGFASFTGQEERVLGALMRVANDVKVALCLEAKDEERSAKDEGRSAKDEGRSAKDEGRSVKDEIQNPDSLSMFALLHETHERLNELAHTNGVLVLPPMVLPAADQPTRFSDSPALALLEQRLFAPVPASPRPAPPPPFNIQNSRVKTDLPQSAIRNPQSQTGCQPVLPQQFKIQHSTFKILLTAAADQRCEVRDVACEILRLCREEGFRFREIAVIARDLAPYQALIETTFHDHDIPHFVDARLDVAHHPLVELVRAALAVAARRWPSQEVIRYAKTDLAALERGAVDRLENYVLQHGIEGEAWYREPWRFHRRPEPDAETEPEEDGTPLEQLNAWREALAGPLHRFERAAAAGRTTIRELSRALFALLEELGADHRLEQWAVEAERARRLSEADEHRQVWDAVADLLDQAVAALGDEEVALDEYRELLEAGLEGIRLRLVPPALDEVLVGSIERSRHPQLRAAFVLGVNERVFPRPQLPDVVFGDRERERLARDGVSLGPVSEKRLLHEQFLAYVAFTRASERLYVSYARADPMGKGLHPSPYLDELKRCVRDARDVLPADSFAERGVEREEPLERLAHWRAALAGLAAGLRRRQTAGGGDRAPWIALYGELRRDGRFAEQLARRLRGLAYENRAQLTRPIAQRLYGAEAESSVSRLETFAACPFRHFARYGLGLEERLRFQLEHFDLGLLYHAVLKDVFERLSGGRPLKWGEIEPARAVAAVEESLAKLAPRLRNEILLSTGRNRHLLAAARGALTTFVRVLIEASKRDGFSQAAAEVDFGRGEGSRYGPLEIALGDGGRLWLRGRIDRVDVAISQPQVIRIIDYKSHTKTLRLAELAYGLTLQLPAYLLAVERGAAGRGKRPMVAGALYVPILRGIGTVPPSEAAGVEAATDGANGGATEVPELKAWKARGFFDFRWAELFDAGAVAQKTRSDIVALALTKEGKPYGGESWDHLADDALSVVLRWSERKAADLGRAIGEGSVAAAPYLMGQVRPCTTCEFLPVCRFDGHREPYRVLAPMKRSEALEWIRGQLGG